uniref:Ig-like domain-containing protein n=1 Tax=Leptobrachium leishanense TaxID=445787 RepID=A0A8C5MLB5_9ANUR
MSPHPGAEHLMDPPGVLLVLVSLPLCCPSLVQVGQSQHVSAPVGSTTMLECWLDGEELKNYSVHWLKQVPGEAPHHILSQSDDTNVHWTNEFAERFQPIRSNGSNFLRIAQVATSDSALYWCSVVPNAFHHVWGNGTRLSVYGGGDVVAPTVNLLISDSSLSGAGFIVCLVTNFYPPVIEVTWKLDGRAGPSEPITGPSFSDGDKSYSLTSVLELSTQQMLNSYSISCEVRHDASKTVISKHTQDCYRNPLDPF